MDAPEPAQATSPAAPSALRGQAGLPSGRASLAFAVMLSLLASLPYWVARTPQLTDYPSHLARYVVMLDGGGDPWLCLLYTSPSPRDRTRSRMPSSA